MKKLQEIYIYMNLVCFINVKELSNVIVDQKNYECPKEISMQYLI